MKQHYLSGPLHTSGLVRIGSPGLRGRVVAWLRINVFSNWWSGVISVAVFCLLAIGTARLVEWGLIHAVWTVQESSQGVDSTACRTAGGACWAIISEKYRLILLGTYPPGEQWRPAICVLLLISLYVVSALPRFWTRTLPVIWICALTAFGVLMWGGVLGLPYVSLEYWGGLPLTLILATFGIAVAFPLSILVALGRRSTKYPALRWICIGYVELIRGVPLVSLLFMASAILPLMLPHGLTLDKLLRAQVGLIAYATAYFAEVIRGGLQALPKGQYEAASALGLSYWHTMTKIVLPQAIRTVIPPLVNTAIGVFKDTSLVMIIGLFDLLSAGKAALADVKWQNYSIEVYLFLAVIYFFFCFAMSRYSQSLESTAVK